jgi:diguanylate cyclase (GGDEF)-like protein
VAALVLLLVALEFLLFRSYNVSERTTREFSDTTNATLYLSNVQQETVLLRSTVLRLERGSDYAGIELRLNLLERQLGILGPAGESEPLIKIALPRINRSLSVFSKRLRAARHQPPAYARPRLNVPLAEFGRQVKSLSDEQEHAQYGALADTLRGGERSQRLIAGLATFALFLSVVLAVFLRRSIRRSFQRAYLALATEVQERAALQERLTQQALHDPLTGLANRRSLVAGLEEGFAAATKERPLVLLLFDLDGFKAYNDTFGHPAGDALLVRLGKNLAAAMEHVGTAYRIGGDEFCVLASSAAHSTEALALTATAALSEYGEAFEVTASYGSVSLPTEATDVSEALRMADQRMYARKNLGSRASAGRQSADVLLRVLSERSPDLGIHLGEVTALAHAVATKLDLPDDQVAPLLQAASLHDVGKAAIPDEILNKPGPLDAEEFEFMRRHTMIGERILVGAPALANAAKLVRSSHERFDGGGYPDGLREDEIPLGSRIISVCDAYDAMTSHRPYRHAMSSDGALSELSGCAGTQFDPEVVDAFRAVIAEREHVPRFVATSMP